MPVWSTKRPGDPASIAPDRSPGRKRLFDATGGGYIGAMPTTPEDLDALQLIAEQAPEGMGVPASSLQSWIDAATIRNLQLEGLVEVVDVDDDLDASLAVTDAGRSVLHPQNSL